MISNDGFLQKNFLRPVVGMLIKDWCIDKEVQTDQLHQHVQFITKQLQSMSWPYQVAVVFLSIIFLNSAWVLSARSFAKAKFEQQLYIWQLWKNSKLSVFRDFISLYESLSALTIFSSVAVVNRE